jgi:uncharacterized membrane protein
VRKKKKKKKKNEFFLLTSALSIRCHPKVLVIGLLTSRKTRFSSAKTAATVNAKRAATTNIVASFFFLDFSTKPTIDHKCAVCNINNN